jgi:hypothetical protein
MSQPAEPNGLSSSLDKSLSLLRLRTTPPDAAACELSSTSATAPATLPRPRSTSRLLDLRDVNITEDGGPDGSFDSRSGSGGGGGGSGGERGAGPHGAPPPVTTPRAAPSISLPKQNRETLRHFAIGVCALAGTPPWGTFLL